MRARLDDIRRHRQTLTAIAAVVVALSITATVAVVANRDEVRVSSGAPASPRQAPTTAPPPSSATVTTNGPTSTTRPSLTIAPSPTGPPTTVPSPTTVPPFSPFDPLSYDRTATLGPEFDSGASGYAAAKRLDPTTWRVTVVVEGLPPGASHSVLVHRPPPDQGTPFPTACSFVAGADGHGTCTGDFWVAEGAAPDNVSVLAGRAVASGLLA